MDPIVGSVVSSVVGLVAKAFGVDTESDDTKVKLAQIEVQAQQVLTQQLTAQASVDQVEAGSQDKFSSRWRPFIGWVCGSAFAYHFLVQPFLAFLCATAGHPVQLPQFDYNTLYTVLMGMLGLGTLHTYENTRIKQ